MEKTFVAILDRADDGSYGVVFPDLPGCTSGGDTIEEASRNAAEALQMHLDGMLEDNEPIPEPSPADAYFGKAPFILVSGTLPGRFVRFNASMDEFLLADIDRAAKANGMTRSAFLAEGARRMLKAG